MENLYHYKPVTFYLSAVGISLISGFAAAYASYHQGMEWLQLLGMVISLLTPCTVALCMIYGSKNSALQQDFWRRLKLPSINGKPFLMLVVLMPAILVVATLMSLLFGYSLDQFQLSPEFTLSGGKWLLSLLAIFLAPLFEELGWRGYGIDSLRSRYTLFATSMIFAALWGLWHVPLFFIKDFYQYTLWQTSTLYTLNFFMSLIPATLLANWLYSMNNRNIIVCILFHAMINLCSVLLQTEQLTKCIITLLLSVIAVVVVNRNKKLFFT